MSRDKPQEATHGIQCTVPGCEASACFVSPQDWCEDHWLTWWNWPKSDPEPRWMLNSAGEPVS